VIIEALIDYFVLFEGQASCLACTLHIICTYSFEVRSTMTNSCAKFRGEEKKTKSIVSLSLTILLYLYCIVIL
jgi:hypothetical protein